MDTCIFCKIVNRESKKEFTYEDDEVVVFPDIHPVKPIHLLIVPKKHIEDFVHLKDSILLEKIKIVIQKVIKDQQLEDKGYRLGINGGGAQMIDHFHVHLMGPMGKHVKI